jgi:hypothetical protein
MARSIRIEYPGAFTASLPMWGIGSASVWAKLRFGGGAGWAGAQTEGLAGRRGRGSVLREMKTRRLPPKRSFAPDGRSQIDWGSR